MIFLLLKHSLDNHFVISPSTYGMKTWGCNSQKDIIKKRKCWYTTYWQDGGDFYDDIYEENKVTVLCETTNIEELMRFASNNGYKTSMILNDLEQIFKDWVAFERWVLK